MRYSAFRRVMHVMGGFLRQATHICRDFSRDPLAHPALQVMSMTELADIPAKELRAQGRV